MEDGSDLAEHLWNEAELCVSSRLVYPEARAALAAARRLRRLDARAHRRAVAETEGYCDELRIIGLDDSLARAAGELCDQYALHAYDAVHLASSLAINDRDLVVATWGRELARAAGAVGRLVAPAP